MASELRQPVRRTAPGTRGEPDVLAQPLKRQCAPSKAVGQVARSAVDRHAVKNHDIAGFRGPADDLVDIAGRKVGDGNGIAGAAIAHAAKLFVFEVRLCERTIPQVGSAHELQFGASRNRIEARPDTQRLTALGTPVGLVLMPRRGRRGAGRAKKHRDVERKGSGRFHQARRDRPQWR